MRRSSRSLNGSPRGAEIDKGVATHLSECSVTIVGSAEAPVKGKPKVFYVLQCTDSRGFSWNVSRRFSDFDALREQLVAEGASALKDGGRTPFPRKTAAKATVDRQHDREAELTTWINTVLGGYSNSHTHQLQRFLEYPGLAVALRNRDYCVHEAVLLHAEASVVSELLQVSDTACRVQDDRGPSTLHVACQASGSEVILRLLAENPEGLFEQGLPSHAAIQHPIHEAARLMLEKEMVQKLVNGFPDHAYKEVDGALPLHVALEQQDRIDWAVVTVLLHANPDAACKTGRTASGPTRRTSGDVSGLPLHRAVSTHHKAEAKKELMRLLIVANPEAALQPLPGHPFPPGWLDEPVAEGVFAYAMRRDSQPPRREWGHVAKTNENGYVVLRWASDNRISGEEWYGELTPVFKNRESKEEAEHAPQISEPLYATARAFRRAALVTKVPAFVKRGLPAGQQAAHKRIIDEAVAEAIDLAQDAGLPVLHLAIALCSDVPGCIRHFLCAEQSRNPCDEERDFRRWLPVHRLVTTVGTSAVTDDTMELVAELIRKTSNKHINVEQVVFGSPECERTTLTHWVVQHCVERVALLFLDQLGTGADQHAASAAVAHAGGNVRQESAAEVWNELEHTHSTASAYTSETRDSHGRTVVELAKAGSEELKRWAYTHKACLKRYTDTKYTDRLEERPMHSSQTAVTQYAFDQLLQENVVLKWMRERAAVLLELQARNKIELREGAIVPVLRWHTPSGERLSIQSVNGRIEDEQFESTDSRPQRLAEHPYLIVLVAGERNAYDACANENLAGHDVDGIVQLMRNVVQCVHAIHGAGIIHGDIKTRNILRYQDSWTLCDMDASANIGEPVHSKASTGYAPPELAVYKLQGTKSMYSVDGAPIAHPSFDIWSLGIVFYELLAGQPLFSLDTKNDELTKLADKNRLCVWNTISDHELAPVFASEDIPEHVQRSARHLLRWCLKGNPKERPTADQVIDHPLLKLSLAGEALVLADGDHLELPMKYAAFISHSQLDASGTANALFMMFDQLGVRTWVDMRQGDLTLEGMRQGIVDSDLFLLILSEHTLERWFCQQELLSAIEHGKKIQIVLELEPRFNPFSLTAWNESKIADKRSIVTTGSKKIVQVRKDDKNPWQAEQTNEQLTELLCTAIDHCLPDAVTYRRRDFEAEAMMRELCARSNLMLPAAPARSPAPSPFQLCVLSKRDTSLETAKTMHDAVMAEVEKWPHVQLLKSTSLEDVHALCPGDRVLLLLSLGVLECGSSTLEQLQEVVSSSSTSSRTLMSRIVMVYDTATWSFDADNMELRAAPPAVQSWIQDHEAIAFRPPVRPDAPDRHEFGTMMCHLQAKLEHEVASTTRVRTTNQLAQPHQRKPNCQEQSCLGVDDRSVSLEAELRDARAQLSSKDAEIVALQLKLSKLLHGISDEGVPPSQPRAGSKSKPD